MAKLPFGYELCRYHTCVLHCGT